MRHQWRAVVLALLAASAACIGSGCGREDSDLPPDVVARVGDASITAAELRTATAALSSATRGTASKPVARRILALLIQQEWIEQEAAASGVRVTPHEVETSEQGLQAFTPTARKLARAQLLRERLGRHAPRAGPISAQKLESYYREAPRRFATPAIRRVQILGSGSRADAERALAALTHGRGWKRVIERYGLPNRQTLPEDGAQGVAQRELEARLDRAVFEAPVGEPDGPIQMNTGWYVFEVLQTFPPTYRTLREARPLVVQALREERQRIATRYLTDRLRQRYQPRTACQKELEVPECQGSSGDAVKLVL